MCRCRRRCRNCCCRCRDFDRDAVDVGAIRIREGIRDIEEGLQDILRTLD